MSKTGYKIFIILTIALCIAPFVLMIGFRTDSTSENKTLAAVPSITTEEGINKEYLSDWGAYFTDHYAFKEFLVSVNSNLYSIIFGVSTEDDVIVGENGYLYYTATLDDYQHNDSVSERKLYNMAHNIKIYQEYVESMGISFIFTIAPNKNSVYGDNMPERYKLTVSDYSDAERLLPYLEAEEVNYVDLFELFNNANENLYYEKDSHWNNKGAVMVYNRLLDEANVRHYDYSDVTPVIVDDYVGDLNKMVYSVFAKGEKDYQYLTDVDFVSADPDYSVEDQIVETSNDSGEASLLMYRDSFGNSLIPYFSQAFEKAYYSKKVPYNEKDIEESNPDLIIMEKVERHIPTLAEVVPTMSALRTEFEGVDIKEYNTNTVCEITNDDRYYIISGEIDSNFMDNDSNVYIELDNGTDIIRYEAYLVSSKSSDYGYKAYIPIDDAAGSDISVKIYVSNSKDGLCLVCED